MGMGQHWRAVLLSSMCLLATASASMDVIINRFGRSLLQNEAAAPSYLLPTQLSQLCTGPNCCQEDDHTSAYQMMMLNSTQTAIAGRTYTTFFMQLQHSRICKPSIDKAGCCSGTVKTVWIDVDPNLNVVGSTLNGNSMNAIQDGYGFRFPVSPDQYSAINSADTMLTVTVAGAIDNLCPIPDLAPVEGLCDIILEGDAPNQPGACCPRGLTTPNVFANWVAPANFFQCQADLGSSPFSLTQSYVSNVFIATDGSQYVQYVLTVLPNQGCSQGSGCCGMTLTDLEVKVLASAQVTGVAIDGVAYKFTQSPWNEGGSAGFQVLAVSGLSLPVTSIPAEGKAVTVTVQIPAGATEVPQLCALPGTVATTYGPCSYYFYQSDNSQCCPSGNTAAVDGPIIPVGCNPTTTVPVADTSMLFTYYEFFNGPKHADFIFQLATLKSCDRKYCVDMCGWTLAVNDNVFDDVMFKVQDISNTANVGLSSRTIAQRGPQATVTFGFDPSVDQAFYRIRTPVGTKLEDVCRANAYPDQGSWPCAATLKAGNIQAVVFFDANSLAIKEYPDFCPAALDVGDSCVRPSKFVYNSPDGNSETSMQMVLTRYDPSTGCKDAGDLSLSIFLQNQPVQELQVSNSLFPSSGISLTPSTGITWPGSEAPTDINSDSSYFLQLTSTRDLSSVCIQGLPDQPPNSCMVQLQNGNACFNGFVVASHDPSFTWSASGTSAAQRAAKIVPAVVVPILVVLVGVFAVVFFVRKRRSFNTGYYGESDLHAPLDPSEDTRAPSDVHIRLTRP